MSCRDARACANDPPDSLTRLEALHDAAGWMFGLRLFRSCALEAPNDSRANADD